MLLAIVSPARYIKLGVGTGLGCRSTHAPSVPHCRGPAGASGLWEAAEVVACGAAGADVILAASGRRVHVPHAFVADSRYAEGSDADSEPGGRGALCARCQQQRRNCGSECGRGRRCGRAAAARAERKGSAGRASMALAAAAAAVVSVRGFRSLGK